MILKLETTKLNDILKTAKKTVDTTEPKEVFRYIALHIYDDLIEAVMFIGNEGMVILKMNHSGCDANIGTIFLPIIPVFKIKSAVSITEIETVNNEICITNELGKMSFHYPDAEPLDYKRILPSDEPKEVFGFNPKLLMKALSAFESEQKVQFDYYAPVRGMIITAGNKKALVMPRNLRKE